MILVFFFYSYRCVEQHRKSKWQEELVENWEDGGKVGLAALMNQIIDQISECCMNVTRLCRINIHFSRTKARGRTVQDSAHWLRDPTAGAAAGERRIQQSIAADEKGHSANFMFSESESERCLSPWRQHTGMISTYLPLSCLMCSCKEKLLLFSSWSCFYFSNKQHSLIYGLK